MMQICDHCKKPASGAYAVSVVAGDISGNLDACSRGCQMDLFRRAFRNELPNQATINMPIGEALLPFSIRARNGLRRVGIKTLKEASNHSESELLCIKNLGQTTLDEIKRVLAQNGLELSANGTTKRPETVGTAA